MIIRITTILTVYGGQMYFYRPPQFSDKNVALFNFRCDLIEGDFTLASFFKYDFNDSWWARVR